MSFIFIRYLIFTYICFKFIHYWALAWYIETYTPIRAYHCYAEPSQTWDAELH